MKNITSYYQALRDRLNAQIQQLVASITEYLLASPDSSHCSCENLQNCRIILITVINEDGTTYLEPYYRNCSCTPIWQEFHQRQLDLINADLKDLQMQTAQLTALENGVQQLLLRHRELAKQNLKKEQYWLRQDYARTDKIRWLHNLDVRKRNERRERNITLNRKRGSVAGNDGAHLDWEKEIPVDAEDLYIDEDFYEFPLWVSGELSSELQCIPQADSNSQNDNVQDPHPVLKTTLNSIRRGQYLTLDSVLDRFEDFKARAATLIAKWEDEDDRRASKIDAVYPWLETQSSCACTAELKLYHIYRDFGNPQVYADLEAEILKSDIRIEQRRKTTADRGLEIGSLLRSFDDHLSSQVADLEAAFGAEGMRKALAAYLRRYDQEIDLRVQVEDGGHPSEAITLELLGRTDEMLERWAVDDSSRCAVVGGNLLKD